jgi:hypothetical protein
MSELRWILLIAGIALIVALYLLGSRNRQRTPVDFERPARVDPPRPAPPVETSRLEPRMSLGEADSQLTMDGPDDISLRSRGAAASVRAATRAPLRDPSPDGPEIAIRPGQDCGPSRSSVRPPVCDRAEHGNQAPHVRPRPATATIAAESLRSASPAASSRFDGALRKS